MLENLLEKFPMPHGHCYLWEPFTLWGHVISDLLIALAYFSIPITLVFFLYKKNIRQYRLVIALFAAFILLCGLGHLVDVYNIWNGTYRLSAVIRIATAVVSVLTAIACIPIIRAALQFPTPVELQMANNALGKANQEIENFAYMASHDMKAPFRNIRSMVQFLEEDHLPSLDDEAKSYLKNIKHSAKKGLSLVDAFLHYIRVRDTKIEGENTFLKVGDIVTQVIDDLCVRGTPNLTIDYDTQALGQASASEVLLSEAFKNLISNAIIHNSKTEKHVTIGRDKDTFFVQDNGDGIPEEFHAKLFERFTRFTDNPDSSGVGTAIIKLAIEKMGGRVWLKSTPEEGTTFFFTLGPTT